MRGGGLALSQGTRRILQERQRHTLKASQAAAAMTASGLLNQVRYLTPACFTLASSARSLPGGIPVLPVVLWSAVLCAAARRAGLGWAGLGCVLLCPNQCRECCAVRCCAVLWAWAVCCHAQSSVLSGVLSMLCCAVLTAVCSVLSVNNFCVDHSTNTGCTADFCILYDILHKPGLAAWVRLSSPGPYPQCLASSNLPCAACVCACVCLGRMLRKGAAYIGICMPCDNLSERRFVPQDGGDLSGTKLMERLEDELVAQTAALDCLLNPSTKRGRRQAGLLFPDNQVLSLPHFKAQQLSTSIALKWDSLVMTPDTCTVTCNIVQVS